MRETKDLAASARSRYVDVSPMERPALDQAVDLLTRGEQILILVPEQPSDDAFCAMVGLALALEHLGKSVTLVATRHVPTHLQFLPGSSQIQETIQRTRDLVITVPLDDVRPTDVRWEVVGNILRFVVTPERGKTFPQEAPASVSGLYPWDRIVVIGSPDTNHLGAPFTDHASFFYETPILNIDHGTTNEFYGTVNLVPATAGTTTEVVADLLDALGGVNLLTPEVATCLFTGILTGTRSFQSPHTTPQTFAIASTLLEQGADRQTIVRHLFLTHTLPELRLTGRGLARLKTFAAGPLWTLLVQRDFTESEGTPDMLPDVLQEIVTRAGDVTPVLLAFERTPGTLEALVYPGRISAEDRAVFEERTNGVSAGPFLLVSLGQHVAGDAERALADRILQNLPTVRAMTMAPAVEPRRAHAAAGDDASRAL